jgi:hypothetical protein
MWTNQRAKWLQNGSLLFLERGPDQKVFCEVISRDVDKDLASPDTTKLPSVVVALTHEQDGLSLILLDRPDDAWQLRQACSSFFGYQPVLRALQRVDSLPFAGRLCVIPPQVPARPPAFANDRAMFNLQSLAKSPAHRTFLAQCDLSRPGADQMYGSHLTLDSNQFAALRVALTNEVGIIQGPPGTGKSFVGAALVRVLMDSVPRLGAVLCLYAPIHSLL